MKFALKKTFFMNMETIFLFIWKRGFWFYYVVIRRRKIEVSMETYWKVNEVAAAIQVSEQTIYRYVANGEIPYHKSTTTAKGGGLNVGL
jgi:excisionase family DNA binding protein